MTVYYVEHRRKRLFLEKEGRYRDFPLFCSDRKQAEALLTAAPHIIADDWEIVCARVERFGTTNQE